jgi:hypothetical protein
MKRLSAIAVALLLTTNAASAQTGLGGIGAGTGITIAVTSVVVFAGIVASKDDANGTNGTN